MERYDSSIAEARNRVLNSLNITRWLWSISMIVTIAGLMTQRYEVAMIAAFASVMGFSATIAGRRAVNYLNSIRQTIIVVEEERNDKAA